MVHGDDFASDGESEDAEWFQKLAVGWLEMEVRGKLGKGADDEKEMVIWSYWGGKCGGYPRAQSWKRAKSA